jgi:AcrR family transcriptional regulator
MLVNSRSQETRRALTRAALKLWSVGDFESAYETTTPAAICRAAGVSRGTFYFHFANKDELLLEMGSELVEMMATEVDAAIARGKPLFALVNKVMTSMATRVASTPRAAAVRSGALGFQVRSGERAMSGSVGIGSAFEAVVRYGTDLGELRPDTDVEDVAAMLLSVTVEAIVRWGVSDLSAAWLRRTLSRRAEIILRGLSPSGLVRP